MYAAFYGLKQAPFSIAPDPHFLFMSEAHREALAHLLYGVSGGGGFVLLTGEIGAGKTTVGRCFLDQIPPQCDIAYVFNPKLTVPELLQTVCDEFRIEMPAGAPPSVKAYVDRLNAFLLDSHAAGRSSVLIIDEAQSLSADVLEQLRLLTNLETAERKLLQIVLIGQPELRTMLAQPELEQLAQRVIARYHLPALSERETAQYIRHRMTIAGLSGELPFDDRAIRRIHALCGGVPRRVNLLCDRALLGGYAGGRKHIDRDIVDRAAAEVFHRDRPPRPAGPRLAAVWALVALVAAAAVGSLWWRGDGRAGAGATAAAGSAASAAPLAAAAPVAASGAASAPEPSVDAATLLPQALRSEAEAWRLLSRRWGVTLPDGEPCRVGPAQDLVCHRSVGGLAGVRELGRPGLLTLYGDASQPLYLLLLGLGEDSATVQGDGATQTVALASLARLWRGEFATFWRAPPGWRDGAASTDSGPLADWLADHLPTPPGAAGDSLRLRLNAFQVAQGLTPDGVAGPLTLMQLNRASGVDEPRLRVNP